jgi:hypothetical protein
MTDTKYCKTCGQNFHASCMQDWLKTNSTCPTCRTAWRRLSDLKTATFDHLDPDGFEVYVQYLYSGEVPKYNGSVDDCIVRLLKAHFVGVAVEDVDFLHAVRRETIRVAIEAAHNESKITYTAVDFAYKNTHGPCPLRRFMCDLYSLTGDGDSLKEVGNVSRLFLFDMVNSFMEKSKPKGEVDDMWGMMAVEGHVDLDDDEDESRDTQQPGSSQVVFY